MSRSEKFASHSVIVRSAGLAMPLAQAIDAVAATPGVEVVTVSASDPPRLAANACDHQRGVVVVLSEDLLERVEALNFGPDRWMRWIAVGDPAIAAVAGLPRAEAEIAGLLPDSAPLAALTACLRSALRELTLLGHAADLERGLELRSAQIHELNRIGVALSTERDHERLLERILRSLRDLTHADAGSLFLVETGEEGEKLLRFTVAQNDSIDTPALVRFTLPMNTKTVAGYVACSGEPLNIPDVYAIADDTPYSFNKGFDERTGYRTQSMLVLPMRNQHGEVMGVVQLINKRGSDRRDPEHPHLCRDIVPFDALATELSTSLTSQAAVCIENQALYEGLQNNLAELKGTQAQLVQSEKLASLGQLTAGVAHEINNPLAFTRNNTHLASERINSARRRLLVDEWFARAEEAAPDDQLESAEALLDLLHEDPELRDDIKEVRSELTNLEPEDRLGLLGQFMDYVRQAKEAQEGTLANLMGRVQTLLDESFIGLGRVAEIVRGLRNFSRLDEAGFQDADIDEGIRQTLMILREPAREQSVSLVADLNLERTYPCFPAKLNQVVLNLVNNAIDASPAGTEVAVTTRERDGFVEIFVRDRGHGIPEHIRTKVFDPFFTTKPVGKGTGLGLSISYRIISEHHGKIAVDPNEDGVGVVFSIRIPVRQPGQQEPAKAHQAQHTQAVVAEVK